VISVTSPAMFWGPGDLVRGALLLATCLLEGQGSSVKEVVKSSEGLLEIRCREEGGPRHQQMGHAEVSTILVSHCTAPSIPSILASISSSSSPSSLTILQLRGGTRKTASRCSPTVSSLTSLTISKSLIGEAAINLLHWILRCAPGLDLLDLSSSSLDSIPTSLRANNLKVLNVSSNRLSELHPGPFASLPALEELDLANNALVKLPSSAFRNSRSLRRLNLNSNQVSFIQRQSFQGLQRLHRLSLSNNDLSSRWLQDDVFSHLHNLKHLEISSNRLTSLGGLVSSIPSLTSLQAANNQINKISDLPDLHELEDLDLSHNAISHLSLFSSTPSLRSLNLAHNNINDIRNNAFVNLTLLTRLNLRGNSLSQLPPSLLSSLENLEQLDLADNQLSSLQALPLPRLELLILEGNSLRSLPTKIFSEATMIRELNLVGNQLRTLDKEVFEPLANLEVLLLDSNQLEDINGVLSSLPVLKELSITDNSLKWFDMAFFPKSLRVINLHSNLIDLIGNYYKMLEGFHLKQLDLSDNRISFLEPQIFVDSLEEIKLEANNISEIAPGTFFGLNHLRNVNLRSNSLTRLPRASLQVSNLASPPSFLLSPNPLLCDCSLEWLLPSPTSSSSSSLNKFNSMASSLRAPLSPPGPLIADRSSLSCSPHLPRGASSSPIPLMKVPPSLLLCQYTEHCFSLCRCCTFLACDCRMKCPDPCSCYHDQSWTLNMIQCSSKNLTNVPREIPMDSTVLHLDGNNFGQLGPEVFLGRTRVTTVHLNGSQITGLTNGSLAGLSALKRLNLQHNLIVELSGEEFVDVVEVEVLHLHHNLLSFVANSTFTPLVNLRVLSLHNNKLAQIALPPALVMVTVSSNPWECSCPLASTLERLRTSREPLEPSCFRPTSKAPVALSSLVSSCKTRSVLAVSSPATSSPLVVLLVTVGVAVLLLSFLSVLLIVLRRPISSWLSGSSRRPTARLVTPEGSGQYTEVAPPSAVAGRKYFTNGGNGQLLHHQQQQYLGPSKTLPHSILASSPTGQHYSAYLHYCLADSDYVQQRLAPGLEEASPGSRLCLHQRDLPTTTTVGQALAAAVRQSRCLIILASEAYFASSIPGYELQMIMAEVSLRSHYPVVVMIREESVSMVRSRLREIVGSQAEGWTYQPVDQQPSWHLAASSSSSSSSRSSNCASSRGSASTQSSTAASSPSPRTLPSKPRLIENPLDSQYSQPLLSENIYHTITSHNTDRLIINKHLDIVKLGGE